MTPLDKLRAIEVDGNAGRCTHWLKAAAKEGANDIDRLERGIRKVLDDLNEDPPRIGDACFDCEALLAGSRHEQFTRQTDDEKCPKCNSDNWPSVNWKNGKSYAYCPDCDHVERS